MNKVPPLKWTPPKIAKVRGQVDIQTIYEPCFCKEETRSGKPSKRCNNCGGTGGVTLLFSDRSLGWLLRRIA